MTTCETCPLGGPAISGSGPATAKLCVVGEAPGRQEVRQGVPFVGPSGQILNETLAEHGLSRQDVYVTNVVMCRPTDGAGNDAPPPKAAVEACSSRLRQEVAETGAKVVLAVGATAAQALLNTDAKITQIHGVLEHSEALGVPIIPTYHPAAVLHGATGFFDDIYMEVGRAVAMATGKVPIPPKVYQVDWEFVRDAHRAEELLLRWKSQATFRKKMHLSIDTESQTVSSIGPRPLDDRFLMFQISDGKKAWSFDVPAVFGNALHAVREILKDLLEHPNITWILHNVQYDYQVFWHECGARLRNVIDVMMLGLGLTERGEQVGLKALSRAWLNAPYYEKELTEPCEAHGNVFKWHTGPLCECHWWALAKYGAYDAYNTYKLAEVLPAQVRAESTMQLVKETLIPAQLTFGRLDAEFGAKVDMEWRDEVEAEWGPVLDAARIKIEEFAREAGFPQRPELVKEQKKAIPCPTCVEPLDDGRGFLMELLGLDRKQWREWLNDYFQWNVLKDQAQEVRERLGQHDLIWAPAKASEPTDPSCKTCMKRRFVLVVDDTFNVNSSLQKRHLCFDVLGMKKPPRGEGVDKEFWAYHPNAEITKLFEDYGAKHHLLTNYIRGITDDVWSDGCVHPDFRLDGTVTGRLSIRNPPMQTLPKWGVADPKLAKMVRKLIVARPGHVIIECDYKNLELFVAHHYSQDANLLKALTEYDFHSFTAAGAFDKPYEWFEPTDGSERSDEAGQFRFLSKFITFGITYGRQAYSLAQGELKDLTGGSEKKAQVYVDRFWNTYPDYKRVYDQWQQDALTKGELRTPLGRVRRWRLIMPQMHGAIRNQAVNFPIQSLASDTCLHALIRLTELMPAAGLGHPLFTVHDSIVAEAPIERKDEAIRLMITEMRKTPFETTTPFNVDAEYGPSLGEVTAWKETV